MLLHSLPGQESFGKSREFWLNYVVCDMSLILSAFLPYNGGIQCVTLALRHSIIFRGRPPECAANLADAGDSLRDVCASDNGGQCE